MKVDLDLINDFFRSRYERYQTGFSIETARYILSEVESARAPVQVRDLVNDDHMLAEVLYHVEAMESAGILDASVVRSREGALLKSVVYGLTRDGRAFLELMRDESAWTEVNGRVARVFKNVESACKAAGNAIADRASRL